MALAILGEIPTEESGKILAAHANGTLTATRVEALIGLGKIARPETYGAVRTALGARERVVKNNAAIAAQTFRESGAAKVAILDVDYHHGNGTQTIFYDRPDVLFCSLHGHPSQEFPFFLGYEDETGEGAGEGFNVNYPLHWGSGWDTWSEALDDACRRIGAYGPDALVTSLGVDTFRDDPIAQFTLDSPNYLEIGQKIAALGRPTLFVMEGGYAVEEIGINAVNMLMGFEEAG